MRYVVPASLLFSLFAVLSAWGQSPPSSEPTELRLQMQRKRIVVRPPIDPETVTQDAEQVQADLAAQARRDQLVEEVTRDAARPRARRPDLDTDVTTGIQQRAFGRLFR
jgi:hypothetical protein